MGALIVATNTAVVRLYLKKPNLAHCKYSMNGRDGGDDDSHTPDKPGAGSWDNWALKADSLTRQMQGEAGTAEGDRS